jgi:nogalonic acid methyl ester cyclase/aklanonic acid methyl ester cyclase
MSKNVDLVKRMVNAYNTGNTDDVEDFIHPEYFNPGAMEHFKDQIGPQTFVMAVKWLKMTFSEEVYLEEIGYEENGDWARAKLVLYGRQVGDMLSMPATGRRFSGEQIHLIRIVDGKIRDHRDWPDFIGTYRQLAEPWPQGDGWRP